MRSTYLSLKGTHLITTHLEVCVPCMGLQVWVGANETLIPKPETKVKPKVLGVSGSGLAWVCPCVMESGL